MHPGYHNVKLHTVPMQMIRRPIENATNATAVHIILNQSQVQKVRNTMKMDRDQRDPATPGPG